MDESGRTGTPPTLACTLPIPWSVGSAHCLNPGGALGMVTEIIRPCSHFLGGNRHFIYSLCRNQVCCGCRQLAGMRTEGLIQQSHEPAFQMEAKQAAKTGDP